MKGFSIKKKSQAKGPEMKRLDGKKTANKRRRTA
jgi:hypothetical protein